MRKDVLGHENITPSTLFGAYECGELVNFISLLTSHLPSHTDSQ